MSSRRWLTRLHHGVSNILLASTLPYGTDVVSEQSVLLLLVDKKDWKELSSPIFPVENPHCFYSHCLYTVFIDGVFERLRTSDRCSLEAVRVSNCVLFSLSLRTQ